MKLAGTAEGCIWSKMLAGCGVATGLVLDKAMPLSGVGSNKVESAIPRGSGCSEATDERFRGKAGGRPE